MEIAFFLFGELPVYRFSILLAVGSTIGLFSVAIRASSSTVQLKLNSGLGALWGALLVGRLTYVGMHWPYFRLNAWEVPQFWLGGIVGSAALAGGLLSVFVIAHFSNQNPGELADALRPLMTAVVVSAFLGCWLTGCFYGPQVAAWWGVPALDEWGEMSNRWPLQIVGAIIVLSISWFIDWINARRQFPAPGMAAALEVVMICLVFLGAAILRVDPAPKVTTNIFTFIVTAAIITLIALFFRNKSTHSPLP